jgi:D-serine deaminase-like pyridoxal phosphate-dependent protein
VTTLPTPAILIDQHRASRNIARMARAASAAGLRLRPHTKTHKSPVVARWQLAAGAVGICCAKLSEAEVFADAGVSDIRIPYPLHPAVADRLIALARRTHVSFIVDHLDVARGWSRVLSGAGMTVDVLVKIDVGFHRCGIAPAAPTAVPFITAVATLPGLRLVGLLSHAGQAYHATSEAHLRSMAEEEAAILRELQATCAAQGVALPELSAGATPTARFSVAQPGLTEYRAGNYVYLDRTQVGLGSGTLDDCALTVLTRVVSAPAPDRLVLDAGSKTLSSDGARGFTPATGYGAVLCHRPAVDGPQTKQVADASLLIERLSEEHATVRVLGATALVPGDLVRIVPNHACVVSNLVHQAWLIDEDQHISALPIAARGCVT